MVAADIHPSIAELESFTLGKLADDSFAAVENHVASCDICQQRAAGNSGDHLVDLLRRVHAQAERRSDTMAEAAAQMPTPPAGLARTEAIALNPSALATSDGYTIADHVPEELLQHERYRVMRLLGEGGMGSVYEAEHRVMHRTVALKVINRACMSRPATLERFRREVRAAARLSHPNIVTTFDAEDAGNCLFLVMEYVEGTSLARLVKERGPLPVADACDYVRQAALGLQHAHERGMVHRDIKPDNLILAANPAAALVVPVSNRQPEPGVVKVLDFGLAALTAERGGELTDENVVMGTPDYMAPEQAEDAHSADVRADVYSLGCTLYFLLTGTVPYPASTPVLKILAHREQPLPSLCQACPKAPVELARVLARMLAKKPNDRYATPSEVAAALEPFTKMRRDDAFDTITLPRVSEPSRRSRPRRRLLVATLTALLLTSIAVAAVVIYRIQTDHGELVITSESEDVKLVISQNGKVVHIIDTKTNKRITLRSGVYELELKRGEGLKLSIDKVTLTRGETVLAKIERVAKPAPAKVGEVRRFEGHTEGIIGIAVSSDGRSALSGGADKVVYLWNLTTGKQVRRFKGPAQVYAVAFRPKSSQILSAEEGGILRLWDVATGDQVRLFEGHTSNGVSGVAFSPDGRSVASAGYDQTLRLWDVETGKEIKRFEGHNAPFQAVAFSPDGRRLISGGGALEGGEQKDFVLRLWDVDTGKEVRQFDGHTAFVRSVAFSPDGRRILSGGGDKTARLWDVETGKEIRQMEGISAVVHGVALSPDGRRALVGDYSSSARLFDTETGAEVYVFRGRDGTTMNGVAFMPDGWHALSGGGTGDMTLRLWRLPDLAPAKDKP